MVQRESTTMDYTTQPYSRVLIPDPSGGFFAEVTELPGCFSQGETPDEAYANLTEAMEGWIEAALETGQQIPSPLATNSYSGRILLRLPKSLHKMAAKRAQEDGVSLNQYLVASIASQTTADQIKEDIKHAVQDSLGASHTIQVTGGGEFFAVGEMAMFSTSNEIDVTRGLHGSSSVENRDVEYHEVGAALIRVRQNA